MTGRRIDQCQHQHCHERTDRQAAWRILFRVGMALNVQPHQEQHDQRHGNMDEDDQREKPCTEFRTVSEVTGNRCTEERQRVQPFGSRDRDILGEHVPYEPITGDAGSVNEPQQRNTRKPGKPAVAAHAVE